MGVITANSSDALLDTVHEAGPNPSPIAIEAVHEELRKIVSSAGFPATERSRKLLEYLVAETLAGRGNRIKAYCIGTGVFGRPESFDPQKDPIVRIEAAKLRRDLEHYYLTDGSGDALVIDIPKGGYVPRFALREGAASTAGNDGAYPAAAKTADATARSPAAWVVAALALLLLLAGLAYSFVSSGGQHAASTVQVPGLLVKPLTDLTGSRDSAVLAEGLAERIIEKTSRFKELAVIAGTSDTGEVPTAIARYEFGGTLRDYGSQVVVQTRLVDRTDGRVIWADSYAVALQPQQLFGVELAIADQIATRIAEPSGALFESERRMLLDTPPQSMSAYLCTLSAYVYRATSSAGKFPAVRACLEQAVAEHPDYATAWALLSLADIDEFRFLYPPPQDNAVPALQRAYDAARRATELDPSNIRAQQALMMVLFFRKDFAAALDAGARALALNPNDVELKGEYGYRLALMGNWPEGCRLIQEARDSSARKIAYLSTALAQCRFNSGDLTGAAALIGDVDAPDNPAYHVIAAAILAAAGEAEASASHRSWLEQNVPRQLPQLLLDMPQRLARPEDRQRFLDALAKAGLTRG